MREEMMASVALIIAVIVGLVTYSGQKNGMTKKQRFIENAKRTGNYAVGEYLDSKIQLGNSDSSDVYMRSNTLKVKYRYQVDGVTYIKQLTFQDPGKVSIDFPISVMVFYDPSNPKKAVCPEEATKTQQRRYGCLITIGMTILTLAVSFYILRFFLG